MWNYVNQLSVLSRKAKVAIQMLLDTVAMAASFALAVVLKTENAALIGELGSVVALAIAIATALVTYRYVGLYRARVRYISGKILLDVGKGALLAALVLVLVGAIVGSSLPVATALLFANFVFLSVGGLRFLARSMFRRPNDGARRPVVIYGAGEAGMELKNALFHGKEYLPVAFVDDEPALHGLSVSGLTVHAPDQLPALAQDANVEVILLAVPSMGRARRREVLAALEELPLQIMTIPGMSEIIDGRARISELRTVSAEDLLGRDPVAPDLEILGKNIRSRVVMVSGAGGSIGSELCRQILSQRPSMLILFEVSEFALYTIEAELSASAHAQKLDTQIVPVLGSVQQKRRLEAVIRAFNVQTIYHAAAYKHVPLVEENVVEGIRNNVFGTLAIAQAAKNHGVENFILISTDKAVRPTNVMGASKRIAELICQGLAQGNPSTTFSMVRFGNVLGSSGSVIPRFSAQIEAGGPVTVTHEDITRYFMTIPEASQLVIQAGAMGKGGDVFVLDMGEPVKIIDLAMSMVKLHGLRPHLVDHADQAIPDGADIAICVTGLRKGEKLYEELLIGNNPSPTSHARIMTASEVSLPMDALMEALDRLLAACETFDLPTILSILRELPLDYLPVSDNISDILWDAEHLEQWPQSLAV